MPTVTLGINPLTWTNDDLPSLGAQHRWKPACKRAAKQALAALN